MHPIFDHIGSDTIGHCKNCSHHHCQKCHTCHRCGCTNWSTTKASKVADQKLIKERHG